MFMVMCFHTRAIKKPIKHKNSLRLKIFSKNRIHFNSTIHICIVVKFHDVFFNDCGDEIINPLRTKSSSSPLALYLLCVLYAQRSHKSFHQVPELIAKRRS